MPRDGTVARLRDRVLADLICGKLVDFSKVSPPSMLAYILLRKKIMHHSKFSSHLCHVLSFCSFLVYIWESDIAFRGGRVVVGQCWDSMYSSWFL